MVVSVHCSARRWDSVWLRSDGYAQADLVIRPPVAQIPSTDFSARKTLIAAGFQAGSRLAPLIRERLNRPEAPRKR